MRRHMQRQENVECLGEARQTLRQFVRIASASAIVLLMARTTLKRRNLRLEGADKPGHEPSPGHHRVVARAV